MAFPSQSAGYFPHYPFHQSYSISPPQIQEEKEKRKIKNKKEEHSTMAIRSATPPSRRMFPHCKKNKIYKNRPTNPMPKSTHRELKHKIKQF